MYIMFHNILSKILIISLYILFCALIISHFFRKSHGNLEGLTVVDNNTNSNTDDDDTDSKITNTTKYQNYGNSDLPSTNQGNIQYLKEMMNNLESQVNNNKINIAKIMDEKEQVERNTEAIKQNSKAIVKATTSQFAIDKKSEDNKDSTD